MATFSHKERRIYFNSKEATAGTADSYANFEARSMTVDFPKANYLQESNLGKMGSGEHGTKEEVQAIFTPVTFKTQRLSEIAFLLSYALGKADTVYTVTTGVYNHELEHLAVTSRTLPTFSFQIGKQAATACDAFTHCIINDFTITLTNGGNGVIDATFNGFCNLHNSVAGSLTRNSTVNNGAFSGANTAALALEPLVNYKGVRFYKGTGLEATPLIQSNVSLTVVNLSGSAELSSVLNSITFGMNNGLSGEELLRAGGFGILNNQERKDQTYSLELNLRKDTDFDAIALANTQFALEATFLGPVIGATAYRYGIDFFWPVVQPTDIGQDSESPINESIPCAVYQDSDRTAFAAYVQNALSGGMNATLT